MPSASATLLLSCDVPCTVEVDGESRGTLGANESKAIPTAIEQHLITATSTEDSAVVWKKAVDVSRPGKTVVMVDLADQLKAARANQAAAVHTQPVPADLAVRHIQAGFTLQRQGQHAAALAEFNTAITEAVKLTTPARVVHLYVARLSKGRSLRELGRLGEACDQFTAAVEGATERPGLVTPIIAAEMSRACRGAGRSSTALERAASNGITDGNCPDGAGGDLRVVGPPGGRIEVDSIGHGVAPSTVGRLCAGDHTLRVVAESGECTIRFHLTANESLTLDCPPGHTSDVRPLQR